LCGVRYRVVQGCLGVALLLTLIAATVWVRARRSAESIVFNHSRIDDDDNHVSASVEIGVDGGAFTVGWIWMSIPPDTLPVFRAMPPKALEVEHQTGPARSFVPGGPSVWRSLGFVHSSVTGPRLSSHLFMFPAWFAALCGIALVAPPGFSLWRARRRRLRAARLRAGLCPSCAYDLRGAAHERCPECDQPVTGRSPSTASV
jgi:hypothetical protein